MCRFHAMVVPVLVLSLIGSGSALAWSAPCCPGAMGQGMAMLMEASAEVTKSDAGQPAPTDAMAGTAAMTDCGAETAASGMCCLGGVMAQPPLSVSIDRAPVSWSQWLMPLRSPQPVTALFRPPKA